MATETDAARDRVLAARAALGGELETLEASARAAVDVPAKIRREPGQGRRRRGRGRLPRARRPAPAVPPGQAGRDRPARALPRVDAARAGREDAAPARRRRGQVRGALERDFAAYAEAGQPGPGPASDPARADGRPTAPVRRPQGRRRAGSSAPTTKDSRRVSPRSASGPSASEGWRRGARRVEPGDDRRAERVVRRPRLSGGPSRPRAARGGALDFAAGEWRNGRRAGLRSRCRVSGVEVRSLSRLQASTVGGAGCGR